MLHKANTVLSLFAVDRPELSAPQIAALLRRPRSTVYRILGAMADEGFLDLDPATGRYRIGIRLAMLGELARTSTSLQRVAHQVLLEVSAASSEMSTLMVLSGDEGVTIDVVESYHPLKIPLHLGGRFPLHATAGGKVLLAAMSQERVDRLLAAPLAKVTSATTVSPAALRRELELVRKQGYATAEQEWLDGVNAVAAPVRDHRGQVIATIAVAAVPIRWKPAYAKKLIGATVGAANRLSTLMGYSSALVTSGSPSSRR